MLMPSFPAIGNGEARGRGLRARAEDRPRCRGQGRPRFVGAVREPGQAAATERTRGEHHCQGSEGAPEPQGSAADSPAERY